MNMLKWIKAKRLEKKHKKNEEKERVKILRIKQIELATTIMENKYCPINTRKCSRNCVNFSPGEYIQEVSGVEITTIHTYFSPPKCMLWGANK